MSSLKKVITAFIICFSISSEIFAANWEKSGPVYFDIDSIGKEGNISSVTVRKSPVDPPGVIYFDCKEKTANAYGWKESINFESIPDLNKIATRACKRFWEIWK